MDTERYRHNTCGSGSNWSYQEPEPISPGNTQLLHYSQNTDCCRQGNSNHLEESLLCKANGG